MAYAQVQIPESGLLVAVEAIQYLGISLYALKQAERRGDLQPFRTPGGYRRYSREMLDGYNGEGKAVAVGQQKARRAVIISFVLILIS